MKINKDIIGLIQLNEKERYIVEYLDISEKVNYNELINYLQYVYECLLKKEFKYDEVITLQFPLSKLDVCRAVQLYYLLQGYPAEVKMPYYGKVVLEITKVDDEKAEINMKMLELYNHTYTRVKPLPN